MKLSGWVYIVIGLCLGTSALLFALFDFYMPLEQASGYNNDFKAQLQTEAGKQARAEKRVRDAMQKVNEAASQWNLYVATHTPSDSLATGGVRIFENPYQLVVDSMKYRNNAQRVLNAQLHRGGVKIVSAPEIPKPTDSEHDILASYYNWPAFTFPVVLWELGQVTVQGTYKQISDNVRLWSQMPSYLAVVDGLQITGTSPNLTGTYNLTVVGFIQASSVFPTVPTMAAAPTLGGVTGGPPINPNTRRPYGKGAVGG